MEQEENRALFFAEHQEIVTPRLRLRPVTLTDAQDMFAYGGDEETTRFVFLAHQTLVDTRKAIATYFMAAPFGKYGIEEPDSGKLIGTIDLRVQKSAAELGYVLNKTYWGKGYVPEAAQVLLKLGFEEMNLARIFALRDVRNQASKRVMEKIGMKQEGVLASAGIRKGEILDVAIHAITHERWMQQAIV